MIDFVGDLTAILGGELGEDAVYAPRRGGEMTVRVIRTRPDEITTFGDARVVSATGVFLVSVAAVPDPEAGDRIEMGGIVYEVQGAPIRDARHLRWRLEAFPVE